MHLTRECRRALIVQSLHPASSGQGVSYGGCSRLHNHKAMSRHGSSWITSSTQSLDPSRGLSSTCVGMMLVATCHLGRRCLTCRSCNPLSCAILPVQAEMSITHHALGIRTNMQDQKQGHQVAAAFSTTALLHPLPPLFSADFASAQPPMAPNATRD